MDSIEVLDANAEVLQDEVEVLPQAPSKAWCTTMKRAKNLLSAYYKTPIKIPLPYDTSNGRYGEQNIIVACLLQTVLQVLGMKMTKRLANRSEAYHLNVLFGAISRERKKDFGLRREKRSSPYNSGVSEDEDLEVVSAAILFVTSLTQSQLRSEHTKHQDQDEYLPSAQMQIEILQPQDLKFGNFDNVHAAPCLWKKTPISSSAPNTIPAQPAQSIFHQASTSDISRDAIRVHDDGTISHPDDELEICPKSPKTTRSIEEQHVRGVKIKKDPEVVLHKTRFGRIVKLVSSTSTVSTSERKLKSKSPSPCNTRPYPSIKSALVPQSPQTIKKESAIKLDFGNRIDQAMLKIDRWIDMWLAGKFTSSDLYANSDLVWESFEFCLGMSDILDADDVSQ